MDQLIEVVRSHKVLYSLLPKDYAHSQARKEIWEQIAQELGYDSGKSAKKQWCKLRECHRDALRRQQRKRRRGATAIRLWRYQKQMEFLLPYMSNRQMKSIPTAEVDAETMNIETLNIETSNETITPAAPSIGANSITSSTAAKKPKLDIIHHLEPRQIQTHVARRDLIKPRDDSQDSLYHFFLSMYRTAMELPRPAQLRIKKQVFDAIYNEEVKAQETEEQQHFLTIEMPPTESFRNENELLFSGSFPASSSVVESADCDIKSEELSSL